MLLELLKEEEQVVDVVVVVAAAVGVVADGSYLLSLF